MRHEVTLSPGCTLTCRQKWLISCAIPTRVRHEERPSPLDMADQQLWKGKKLLDTRGERFLPAINNKELGGMAMLRKQRAEANFECTIEGMYAIWHGKGPGVDRAGDELKHGNEYVS